MKRMIMMAMMAVFAVTAAFADDDEFKVVEGSFVDVVRQPGKTATVEFDYLDATIQDKEESGRTLKKWLQEEDPKEFDKWDSHMADAKEFFTKRWNEEKKKNLKVVDGDQADYRIIIKASKFSTGNSGAAYWSMSKRDGGIIISGDLTILDASGKTVCKVDLIDYRGASSRTMDFKVPNFTRRMKMFHKSLAKDLLEDIKK
ncbi:MAG: hypothetical protein J5931_02270 [Prevotella sp.]|nr:hypothetical protein [Prevotella sp.]